MGTTRSFLLLKNRSFTSKELKQIVSQDQAQIKTDAKEARASMANALGLGGSNQALFQFLSMINSFHSHGALAYRADAKWLPYFITELCDGHNCSSRELLGTSERFQTPVLAFSIFDSDILFVSYCDAERRVFYDFVKPNYPDAEEYDPRVYKDDFPAFLLSLDEENRVQQLGDIQKLKDIWNEADMVFADDRMHNILQFLGMQVIYDENDIPEGFTRIGK